MLPILEKEVDKFENLWSESTLYKSIEYTLRKRFNSRILVDMGLFAFKIKPVKMQGNLENMEFVVNFIIQHNTVMLITELSSSTDTMSISSLNENEFKISKHNNC